MLKRSRAARMLRSCLPNGLPRYIALSANLIQEVAEEILARLSRPMQVIAKRVRWDEGLLIYYPISDQRTVKLC